MPRDVMESSDLSLGLNAQSHAPCCVPASAMALIYYDFLQRLSINFLQKKKCK